ncbi:unnamed protein product, partial [Brassica oleracea]
LRERESLRELGDCKDFYSSHISSEFPGISGPVSIAASLSAVNTGFNLDLHCMEACSQSWVLVPKRKRS